MYREHQASVFPWTLLCIYFNFLGLHLKREQEHRLTLSSIEFLASLLKNVPLQMFTLEAPVISSSLVFLKGIEKQ